MEDQIRRIVAEHGRLAVDVSTLSDDADLYQAGLNSHASVSLMLALEDAFDVLFPEELLTRETFSSITALTAAVAGLLTPAAT